MYLALSRLSLPDSLPRTFMPKVHTSGRNLIGPHQWDELRTQDLIIFVDGIDAVGKTSVCCKLRTSLLDQLDVPVNIVSFERTLENSTQSDRVFKRYEISDFLCRAAAFFLHLQSAERQPEQIHIFDRCIYSLWAQQMLFGQNGFEQPISKELLTMITPDISLLLDGDPQVSKSNAIKRDGQMSPRKIRTIENWASLRDIMLSLATWDQFPPVASRDREIVEHVTAKVKGENSSMLT